MFRFKLWIETVYQNNDRFDLHFEILEQKLADKFLKNSKSFYIKDKILSNGIEISNAGCIELAGFASLTEANFTNKVKYGSLTIFLLGSDDIEHGGEYSVSYHRLEDAFFTAELVYNSLIDYFAYTPALKLNIDQPKEYTL